MIEQQLQEIEAAIQKIREELHGFGLSAHREGGRIKVEANKEFSELQFKVGDNHVSVQEMLHSGFEPKPPALPDKEYLIGNSDNIEKSFEITVGNGYWNGDKYILQESETITLPAKENYGFDYYGFWDSRLVPDEFPCNVSKGYLGQLSNLEGDLIPIISGFDKDDPESKIRSRFEDRKELIDGYKDRIKLIILQDEPFYKGFTKEKLEQIVSIGKEVLGDYKLGYTFADANADSDLPTNTDFAGFNSYLFFEEDYDYQFIDTEQAFRDEMDRILKQAKESIGDMDILIVAQTFSHPGKYRDPHVESPLWYARYASDHPNVIGVLNYRWRYENGKGLQDFSEEFKDNVKKAYSLIKR